MKISKREKMMLGFLGLLVVGFLYYQFGIVTLGNYVAKESQKRQEIEKRYQDAVNTISNKDEQLKNIKVLNAKIGDEIQPFYPTISQEHLIVELDDLIKKSGLYGGMKFKDIQVSDVGTIKKTDKDIVLPKSSLQDSADQYNTKYAPNAEWKNTVKETAGNTSNSTNAGNSNGNAGSAANSSTNTTNTANSSNTTNKSSDNNASNVYTVSQLEIEVHFNGSYAELVKFLSLLKENEKQLPSYQIDMQTKNINEVKGNITLRAYAIPKIEIDDKEDGDTLTNYLEWKFNNPYGKDKPFTVNSAAGTGIKLNKDSADFLATVRGVDSDLPTVTIGRANDNLRTSYVYADSSAEAQIQVELTKVDDKYYYKYKSDRGSVPSNYGDQGIEFVPNGDNIEFNIQSESRRSSDDDAGLKLNVINKTDKLVNVNVSGDDKSRPRVSLDGDTSSIHLNEK